MLYILYKLFEDHLDFEKIWLNHNYIDEECNIYKYFKLDKKNKN